MKIINTAYIFRLGRSDKENFYLISELLNFIESALHSRALGCGRYFIEHLAESFVGNEIVIVKNIDYLICSSVLRDIDRDYIIAAVYRENIVYARDGYKRKHDGYGDNNKYKSGQDKCVRGLIGLCLSLC